MESLEYTTLDEGTPTLSGNASAPLQCLFLTRIWPKKNLENLMLLPLIALFWPFSRPKKDCVGELELWVTAKKNLV